MSSYPTASSDDDSTDSLNRTSSWDVREQERITEVIIAVKARGRDCTEEEAKAALVDSYDKDEAVDKILTQIVNGLPFEEDERGVGMVCTAFEFVRNPPGDGGPSFQSFADGLSMARAVICGDMDDVEGGLRAGEEAPSVEEAWSFVEESPQRHSETRVQWGVNVIKNRTPSPASHRLSQEADSENANCLRALTEAAKIIDKSLEHPEHCYKYVQVLRDILNKDNTWYAGKTAYTRSSNQYAPSGRMAEHIKGCPEHYDSIVALVFNLDTLNKVRKVLSARARDEEAHSWADLEFTIGMHALKDKYEAADADASHLASLLESRDDMNQYTAQWRAQEAAANVLKAELGAEIRQRAGAYFDNQLDRMDRLQCSLAQAYSALGAVDKSNKEARVAAEQAVQAVRLGGDQVSTSLAILSALKDLDAYLDTEQHSAAHGEENVVQQICARVIQALCRTDEKDAKTWNTHAEEAHCEDLFTQVFELLNHLLGKANQQQYYCELHCALQCWRTDSLPKHSFGIKTILHLAQEKVHAKRSVDGPGVGQVFHCQNRSFEVLEIVEQLPNKRTWKDYSPSTQYSTTPSGYWDEQLQFEIKYKWRDTDQIGTETIGFPLTCSHRVRDPCALSAHELHAWLEASSIFEDLFGKNFHLQLLGTSGKELIQYMSNLSLLSQHHADVMVGRISKAHRSEKAEAHARLLDVLVSLNEAGQAHLLGVIAELLPDAEVIEMLLSKEDLCEMLSSHDSAAALLDCLLRLMGSPDGVERLEELQSLFAEVIRTEEETRRENTGGQDSEEFVVGADTAEGVSEEGDSGKEQPLRVLYLRQCRQRIESGGAEADAAYGLLHQILVVCQSMQRKGTISLEEYDFTFNELSKSDTPFMSTIINSFDTILTLQIPKPAVLLKLQPRLALLAGLISLTLGSNSNSNSFDMADLDGLHSVFVTLHPGFFETFLEWFASLTHMLDMQLARHGFLLISAHDDFKTLSLEGFTAFKRLFVQVNGLVHQTSSQYAPASLSVQSLALDGLSALWKAALSAEGATGEAARELLRSVYLEHTNFTGGSHDPLLMATFRCLSFCSLALSDQLPGLAASVNSTNDDEEELLSMSGTLEEELSFDPVELITVDFMDWSVEVADNALALLEESLAHTQHEAQTPSHRCSHFGTPLEIDVDAKRFVESVGNGGGVGSKSHSWQTTALSIVTHTNSTLACFKSLIAANLGIGSDRSMILRYADRTDVRGEQAGVNLKGSTLQQAGLDPNGDFKVFATVLPSHKQTQPPRQAIADAIMHVPSFYETLFDLCAASVGAGERQLSMRVWQLIQSLPSSSTALNDLELPDTADWEAILGVYSVPTAAAFKAAYIAQIVSAFLQPADPGRMEWSRSWRRGFITDGGYVMMNRFFIDLVSHFATPMPLRVQYALSAVLKVLRFCITGALRTNELDIDSISIGEPVASSPFKADSVAIVKQVDYRALLHALLEVLRVQSSSHDETVAINTLHTIVPLMSTSEEYALMILSEPDLLSRLLVHNQSEKVRKATRETLFKLCEQLPSKSSEVLCFVHDALQGVGPTGSTISEALDLLALLLEHPEAFEQATPLLRLLLGFVQQFPEQSEDDTVLTKCLLLFADLISRWPELIHTQVTDVLTEPSAEFLTLETSLAELVLDLLWSKCLYGDDGTSQPKCATVSSRDAAGRAMLEIVKDSPGHTRVLLERLHALHMHMPASSMLSWDYWYLDPNTEAARRPAKGGYLGLKNQGLCCYQNSILQQLYLIPEIRSGVLASSNDTSEIQKELDLLKEHLTHPPEEEAEFKQLKRDLENKTEQLGQVKLLAELQRTFAHLNFGVGSYYDPVKFVDACEGIIRLDHPVREQNDANDFFNKLCDQMDQALKPSRAAKLFENHMRIVTESEWSINHNGETLTRPGPEDVALAINIEVEGQSNLEESLALNFQPEDGFELTWQLPDGTEQTCESTKTPRIKTAPKTLVFNLKRYVFSLETLEYARCADQFEFPRTIDIGPYMINTDSCTYTLSGVVIHEGSSGGGHYYSYARDRNTGNWFRLDDSTVTPWDVDASLADDTFGGSKTSTWTNQYGEPKSWSCPKAGAYVLFYDQETTHPSSHHPEDQHECAPVSSPESSGSCAGDSLEQLQTLGLSSVSAAYDAVMEQNAMTMRASHVCNLAHMRLVLQLLRSTTADQELLPQSLALAAQFFFSTVVRVGYRKWTGSYGNTGPAAKEKEEERRTPEDDAVEELMNAWKSALTKGFAGLPEAREQMLQMQSADLKRLLLDCPHDYARKIVAALLIKACDTSQSKLQLFLRLLGMMVDMKATNAAQFGQILCWFAVDSDVKAYMRSKDVPAQILHYLLGPKTPVKAVTVTQRAWGSRHYSMTTNQEVFIKCLCQLIAPLDGLPELSRSVLELNPEVRAMILSCGDANSVKMFVEALAVSSEQSTLGVVQYLAQAPGTDDVFKTSATLVMLLKLDENSPTQLTRVKVALATLKQEAELACHQGTSRATYSTAGIHNRVKRLVQILVQCSTVRAVKSWIDHNKEFLVSVRQAMHEMMRESRVTTSTGHSYTEAAKIQRTKSAVDAEQALNALIGEFECVNDAGHLSESDFERRVDDIHELLKDRATGGASKDSYEDKREWCVMAAKQETDSEAAVDWILNNECSLSNSEYSNSNRKRRTPQSSPSAQLSSDDENIYGPI